MNGYFSTFMSLKELPNLFKNPKTFSVAFFFYFLYLISITFTLSFIELSTKSFHDE